MAPVFASLPAGSIAAGGTGGSVGSTMGSSSGGSISDNMTDSVSIPVTVSIQTEEKNFSYPFQTVIQVKKM